jgi:hypothetical protein
MNKLNVLTASNVRDIIKQANDIGITKDNFISLVSNNNQWFLIYSK